MLALVLGSIPQLAQFLRQYQLTLDPIQLLRTSRSAGSGLLVPSGDRVVYVHHTSQMCRSVQLQTMDLPWSAAIHRAPGIYTYVVELLPSAGFRLRYKPMRWPGEIGSKHICLVDANVRHLVLAGEFCVRVDGTSSVNIQSGTFMPTYMNHLRHVLFRTEGDPEGVEDRMMQLWWQPFVSRLFPASTFVSDSFVFPERFIEHSVLDALHTYDPGAVMEFVTQADCGHNKSFRRLYVPGLYVPMLDHLMAHLNGMLLLRLTSVLRRGDRYTVYRGMFGTRPCACKVSSSRKTQRSLCLELEHLVKVGPHTQIVQPILGCCIYHAPVSLLLLCDVPYTLAEYLATYISGDKIPLMTTMVTQVSSALEQCHDMGYMHLNLSEYSILCDNEGCCRLSGFGKMQVCDPSSRFAPRYHSGTRYESHLIAQRVFQTFLVDWHSLTFLVYRLLYGPLPWEQEHLGPECLKTWLLTQVQTDTVLTRVLGQIKAVFIVNVAE